MGLSNTSLNYLNYPTQVRTTQTKNSVFVFVLNNYCSFLFNYIIFFHKGLAESSLI